MFVCFCIVTTSEFIHIIFQCMGRLNPSQDPLNFVSKVLKGSWNVFLGPHTFLCQHYPCWCPFLWNKGLRVNYLTQQQPQIVLPLAAVFSFSSCLFLLLGFVSIFRILFFMFFMLSLYIMSYYTWSPFFPREPRSPPFPRCPQFPCTPLSPRGPGSPCEPSVPEYPGRPWRRKKEHRKTNETLDQESLRKMVQ